MTHGLFARSRHIDRRSLGLFLPNLIISRTKLILFPLIHLNSLFIQQHLQNLSLYRHIITILHRDPLIESTCLFSSFQIRFKIILEITLRYPFVYQPFVVGYSHRGWLRVCFHVLSGVIAWGLLALDVDSIQGASVLWFWLVLSIVLRLN